MEDEDRRGSGRALSDVELDHVSGGASGLIYKVAATAFRFETEAMLITVGKLAAGALGIESK